MRKPRSFHPVGHPIIAIVGAVLGATLLTAAAAGSAAPASAQGSRPGEFGSKRETLPDSVASFATPGRESGSVPAASRLTLQFWLAPRTAAAEGYAVAVSTAGSPLFRHYLSPSAYTERFGATSQAAARVESWLSSAGFTGITADPGRDYVRATASASTIDTALEVRLREYRAAADASAGEYPLRANDRPVTLPASVARSVVGVTGLDNASPVMTYARAGNPGAPHRGHGTSVNHSSFPCSQWYRQHYATGLPAQFGATRFPTLICGYAPQQLRRAYGYNGANDGRGVTIALVEVGLTPLMFQTLQTYAGVHGIETPSPQRYTELSLGQGSACGDPFNVEEQLDVESSYDLAPMANQLVVGGDSCNNGDYGLQALYDADTTILNGADNHPLAPIASNSWEGGDEAIPANLLQVEHDYLLRAAAEGVTMLFSSGDSSGVSVPSSDPYATAVGATTLGIGHDNPRLFETGWSTEVSSSGGGPWVSQGEQGAAGGGASLLWKQPGYQRGVVPAALATAPGDRGGLVRALPDISAVGDPFTGMATGLLSLDSHGNVTGYYEESIGGTSLASPLVAGVLADAEQGSGAFGFINPALYRLARAGTRAFHDAMPLSAASPTAYRGVACDAGDCGVLSLTTFDDQSWSMTGYTGEVTAPGFDTMTGLGTPNGQAFITALRRL